jgi:hypothetical protein
MNTFREEHFALWVNVVALFLNGQDVTRKKHPILTMELKEESSICSRFIATKESN